MLYILIFIKFLLDLLRLFSYFFLKTVAQSKGTFMGCRARIRTQGYLTGLLIDSLPAKSDKLQTNAEKIILKLINYIVVKLAETLNLPTLKTWDDLWGQSS